MSSTSPVPSIILMVVLLLMIYFMMIRPQKKKDKADREMRESLKVGDEIITIGGIIGKVEKVTEKTVVISTGAQKNKIEFIKNAIASVSKGEASKAAEAKAAEAKQEVEEEKKPDRDKKVTPKKLTKKSDSEQA